MSARAGGVSQGPYAACNLGDHVQDDARAVRHNRGVFEQLLGAPAVWLQQVHGDRVLRLGSPLRPGTPPVVLEAGAQGTAALPADGAFTTEPGVACVVMVADCLPLLLAAPEGRGVAALHAGWRGLAGAGAGMTPGQGIVHSGVRALCEATSCDPADLAVWLGPCIGPRHFEVGADVLAGFGVDPASATPGRHPRFVPHGDLAGNLAGNLAGEPSGALPAKWLADLPGLARDTLARLGVRQVSGGEACTVSEPARFFSFRRDGRTGRQAAGICLG